MRLMLSIVFCLGLFCYPLYAQDNAHTGDKNNEPVDSSTTTSPTPTTTTSASTDPPKKPSPKKLISITLLDPPFVMLTPRGEKCEGLAIDILNAAMKDYDVASPIIHESGKFGYEEHPGKWNGLIGALQNKTADVAIAAFTINSPASKVVTFSQPFMHAGFRVLYKIPDSWYPSDAMVTVLRPFTPGLWVLIVFMFAITSGSLYIVGRFSPFEDIAFVGKTATYDGLTVPNSLLYVFSSLVWQGYTSAPKSISGRIVTCVWWIFSVFTIGAYIAGLCVVLFKTNPEIRTLPFTTMEEMSRQSKVGIMVVRDSAAHTYLSTSPDSLGKRIFAMVSHDPKQFIVNSTEDAIKKVSINSTEDTIKKVSINSTEDAIRKVSINSTEDAIKKVSINTTEDAIKKVSLTQTKCFIILLLQKLMVILLSLERYSSDIKKKLQTNLHCAMFTVFYSAIIAPFYLIYFFIHTYNKVIF